MTTMPVIHPNDPVYQGNTKYDHLTISEMISDDEGEGCLINGEYLFAEGECGSDDCIIYTPESFVVIPKTQGYFPVMSEATKKDCILELLKDKHGRNINFL